MSQMLLAGIAIFVLLVIDLAVLNYLNKRMQIHPEVLRKILHASMGMVAAVLPWVFTSSVPVILLGMACIMLLLLIKYIKSLKQTLGGSLNLVNRNSLGEIYFTIGVVVTFILADGDKLLYVLPILILSLSDALAALTGVFGGIRRFTTPDGEKTVLGSTSFFLSALLISLIYLQIFTDLGFSKIFLISMIMGIALMLFEAIAWKGMDNLLVPVASFLLLNHYLPIPLAGLYSHFIVLITLFLILIFWQRYSSVKNEVILIAILYGYFSWITQGMAWLAIGFSMLIIYPFLSPRTEITQLRTHGMNAAFSVLATGLVWMLVEYYLHYPYAYYFYALGFAMHMSLIQLIRLKQANLQWSCLKLIFISGLQSYFIIFAIYLLFEPAPDWKLLVTAVFIIILGNILFRLWQGNFDNYPSDQRRWMRQFSLVTAIGILYWQCLQVIHYV